MAEITAEQSQRVSRFLGSCQRCGAELEARLDLGDEAKRLQPPPHVLVVHACAIPVTENWLVYSGPLSG
jgi:hypothetical protein